MPDVFLYIFAAYGAFCFVYWNFIQARLPVIYQVVAANGAKSQLVLVVKVKDAEDRIENLVSQCIKSGRQIHLPHRLVFYDDGSTDQTKLILERLVYRYPFLEVAEGEGMTGRIVAVEYITGESPSKVAQQLTKAARQEFSI